MKKNNLSWSIRIFVLSIALSVVFSVLSQSLFPNLPVFLSIFIIVLFIVVSVVFDMLGIAVTSLDAGRLQPFENQRGHKTAVYLCQNTNKVSSFCGDVVGDICGILSGAGGVSLVVNMHLYNSNLYFIVTCLVSSLIAGLTIFGKAIMKGYAVENCVQIVMWTSRLFETTPVVAVKNILNKIKKNRKKS